MKQQETLVTTEMAISRLIRGLRSIPDEWTGIGHSSSDHQIRTAAAARMVAWGRGFADEIEAMPVDQAVSAISRSSNDLANLDPRGSYLGSWAHVAVMVNSGKRYVLQNGVLGSYCSEAAYQDAVSSGRIAK